MAGFKSKIGEVYYENEVLVGIGGGKHPIIVHYHKVDNNKNEWVSEDGVDWWKLDFLTTDPLQ